MAKEPAVGAITLRALKMTGYTLNIRSHLSYQSDILPLATIQKKKRDGEKKTIYFKKRIAAHKGSKQRLYHYNHYFPLSTTHPKGPPDTVMTESMNVYLA